MIRSSRFVAAAMLSVVAAPGQAHHPDQALPANALSVSGEKAPAEGDKVKSDRKIDESLARRIIVAPSTDGRSHVAREDVIPRNKGTGIRLTNLWLAPATPLAKDSHDLQGFVPFTMQQLREPLYAITLVEYPVGTGKADPGMHSTATVDHFYVIEGEIILVLEKGEAALRAGDVAVVQGAVHGWRNDGARPARLLFFTLPTR
jgi:mannose-6-phosphate isomerase-like protein (cupin superfamily)